MSSRAIAARRRLAARIGIDPRWAVLWVVLSGLFTTGFTITLLVVSLSRIADQMHTTTTVLTWAITGPMLAFGVVGPAFGKAGDLWGHKRVFVSGLFFASVFALLSAKAWNPGTLILFRTLSATAGSACSPSAMAYINSVFAPGERLKPLGYWNLVTAASPVVGVVIGGPLVEAVGWRVIFLVQAPLCAVGFVIALWLLPTTARVKNVKFDVWGSVTLGVGASSLLAAISQGRVWGWASARTIGCMLLAVVALRAFLAIERRTAAPLVVLDWFRTRNFAWPVLCQGLGNFAYMGGFFLIPQVLGSRGLGLGEATIGYLVIARPLAFSLIAPVAAAVTVRVGERVAGVAGGVGILASMLLWATVGQHTGYVFIIAATAMSGIGLGISSPAMTALMAGSVASADLGVAGAMQQLVTQLGSVMGSAVLATVSTSATRDHMGMFHVAFVVGGSVAVLAALAGLMVRPTRGLAH